MAINDVTREKLVQVLAEILDVTVDDVGNHVIVALTKTSMHCSSDCAGFHHLTILSSINEATPTMQLLEKASDTLVSQAAAEIWSWVDPDA